MKKILVGLTLLASMSSFASSADCDDAIEGLITATKDTASLELSVNLQEKALIPEAYLQDSKSQLKASVEMMEFEKKRVKSHCNL